MVINLVAQVYFCVMTDERGVEINASRLHQPLAPVSRHHKLNGTVSINEHRLKPSGSAAKLPARLLVSKL